MNILFLARYDPRDINRWSGTLFHIYHKLKEKNTIEVVGAEILNQVNTFAKGNFPPDTFIPLDRYIKNFNRLLSERIIFFDFDLLFFGDLLFIPLDINIPYVLFTDMIYEQVKIHFEKPDEKDIKTCTNLEGLLFDTTYKIIFTSEWIKEKAIESYHVNPSKIHVVEFGANIPTPTNYTIDIDMNICRLVFIGKNWKKKGGDKVLQAYRQLKSEGFPCTLTIIGSVPENELEEDKDLTIIPFLNKAKKEHLERLCAILSESHFLVLPTEFDAFGIVFCEASAYALPSIAANVGGVGQAVKEGKNGYLLPADATANDYAEKIKTVFNDKENYFKLRQSARNEFEIRLNWDVWGEKVNKILEDAVEEWKLIRS